MCFVWSLSLSLLFKRGKEDERAGEHRERKREDERKRPPLRLSLPLSLRRAKKGKRVKVALFSPLVLGKSFDRIPLSEDASKGKRAHTDTDTDREIECVREKVEEETTNDDACRKKWNLSRKRPRR